MSRIIICLLLSLFTYTSCAQKTVKHVLKTTDGATVKLYSDYTWEYTSLVKSSYGNKNSEGAGNLYTYNTGLSSSSKKSSTAKKKTTTRKSSAGRVYHRGPRGGCYYYTSGGSKVYVDRSYCN